MQGDRLHDQLVLVASELGGGAADVKLDRPRSPEHGDLTTNLAFVLAGRAGRPPRQVAQEILERLDLARAGVSHAEVAGPGFINFRLARDVWQERLAGIIAAGRRYGRSEVGGGRRVQVEFVSANPTGPLHVAHGRGAALGDAIASLLDWTGWSVTREFYVNDAGVQIERLAQSLDARWREHRGEAVEFPEDGYHGDYIRDLARDADAAHGDALAGMSAEERLRWFRDFAVERLREEQDRDLREFRVYFDEYFSETSLYETGLIDETLRDLEERGFTYRAEGALWLRTTAFGDDKDRVLIKRDGNYTYLLPDIAYHRQKLRRGFERLIDVWGADHHGYAPRMHAALAALGHPGVLEVEIVQMVRILRGGREVRLSKRSGEFVTLRDLFRETGVDVARYFFLMRRGDAQMVFDLDLALDHSEKNPVYKVQYAHARMMSIFRKAGVDPQSLPVPEPEELARLAEPVEQELIKQLTLFPEIVERAAEARAPHMICDYLEATAGMVNSWYHAGNPSRNPGLAVLVEDEGLRRARLALCRAIAIVLANGLSILGLTAPERMEREEPV